MPAPDPAFSSDAYYLQAIHDQWVRQDSTIKLLGFLEQHRKYLHSRALETRATPDTAIKYLNREHFLNGLITVIKSGEFMSQTTKINPETY